MTSVDLATTLRERRDAGSKLLVPYVMGGMIPDWLDLVRAIADAGADAIEVGIPFSDPMMDGPIIQEASVRALDSGATPTTVLDTLSGADIGVPIAVMTYYNLVFRAGHHRMAGAFAAAGVSGAILPDLPIEEFGTWAEEADAAGVATIMLVAPSTPEKRVATLCERSRGFVYAVARMGVTGERSTFGGDAAAVVARIQAVCDTPVCVGIGVSTADQAVEVCQVADGAVVGSALVRRALEGGVKAAAAFVGELRAALDANS